MGEARRLALAAIVAALVVVVGGRCHAAAGAGQAVRWRVLVGALEAEVTPAGLDVLWYKDRWLLGDGLVDPRPVVEGKILTAGWRTIASTKNGPFGEPQVERLGADVFRFTVSGTMAESGGPGRWRWRQVVTVGRRRVAVEYALEQLAAPRVQIIKGGYRLQFIVPQVEVLGRRRPENVHQPGRPVQIETAGGRTVTVAFGGRPGIVRAPRAVVLPFEGRAVRWEIGGAVEAVELWNGGWRQAVNFFLTPGRHIAARVSLDLSQLDNGFACAAVERVPGRAKPWLDEPPPPRRRPAEVLRLVQATPAIIGYDKPPRHVPREEKDRFMDEVAKHFEVIEVMIAWSNWWYALWDAEPQRRRIAEAIAAEAQEWIDAAHRHGVLAAVSLSWAAPGCSQWETALVPQYQGEYFDPDTGRFIKDKRFFDWSNDEAVEFAYRAWRDVARMLRGADFLFFNEPHWRLQPWHRVAMFSRSALASWRRFLGDDSARLPAKPWCRPTDRTDNAATARDWRRWQDWMAMLYARMLRTEARAVADANANNPRYRGAIWFQNKGWVGPQWACDLDRVFAIAEITYVVCEYCTDPREEIWRQFKYYAHKHGKKLGSFVNFGYYDARKPGRVRFEGTDEAFARAVGMGVEEKADMLAAYPVAPVLPWSPAWHAARTRIWDEITGPYVGR